MIEVEERVDLLEHLIRDFVFHVGVEFNKLYNSQMRTEAELRVFKDEMRTFKDEMRADTQAFKEEMLEFKNEMRADMQAFKEEMLEFKNEMRADTQVFKEEMRAQNREMNRRWGEMSNKLGTMVEDLIWPSLSRIVQEIFGQKVIDLSIRHKRHLPDGRVQEFDAIAVTTNLVCLNSTKATLRRGDVDRFVAEIDEFRIFFPEHKALPVVGALASLSVDESVLNYAEKTGFLVLAVGDQLMDVQNQPGFVPKRWLSES